MDLQPRSFFPGEIVQTRDFRLLYSIVKIDEKRNRVICKPITYSHFREPFVFPPDYLIRVESLVDASVNEPGTELLRITS